MVIPKSLDVDALIRRVPFDVAGVAIANCSSLWQDNSMTMEAFLERVPDADISILQCSICKEQFHTSPVGPRKSVGNFPDHVRAAHPQAVIRYKALYKVTSE